MTSSIAQATKTIVATGTSSGLGFELIKILLSSPTSLTPSTAHLNLVLGARDINRTGQAYNALSYPKTDHILSILPLELSSLKSTASFASATLERLGPDGKIDYLLLNAAVSDGTDKAAKDSKSGFCEAFVVNHLSQHYLVHLLEKKLIDSATRIIFVSSGAIRRVTDPSTLEKDLEVGSGVEPNDTYAQTKFLNLLSAQWWRRRLEGKCRVVAVSPGLIPNTGIGRGSGMKLGMDMPDAKSVEHGAKSILAAFTRDDFPSDREQMFLTSWGEWWEKGVYEKVLDRELQDKWCWSKEEIEEREGLV
ncbi:hypothetical protein QBC40DRAFT_84978 [Triangularia verruculosa]|uniref:Uncharacterized protein n=1 Tax=Triangularia verruculosa TaxID=2587418 RepID=A0AAN6XFP6_9PEZI|nr:hypothetical protein QBC40DRAFT_84978 [Triangularia verruculosa]